MIPCVSIAGLVSFQNSEGRDTEHRAWNLHCQLLDSGVAPEPDCWSIQQIMLPLGFMKKLDLKRSGVECVIRNESHMFPFFLPVFEMKYDSVRIPDLLIGDQVYPV